MSRLLRDKINSIVSVEEAWLLSFGTPPSSGKVFCPFHNNTHTPAAKIYPFGLKCFGECNRVFTAFDILKKFNPDYLEKLSESYLPEPSSQTKSVIHVNVPFSIEGYYGN
jgi:hypothetical protein